MLLYAATILVVFVLMIMTFVINSKLETSKPPMQNVHVRPAGLPMKSADLTQEKRKELEDALGQPFLRAEIGQIDKENGMVLIVLQGQQVHDYAAKPPVADYITYDKTNGTVALWVPPDLLTNWAPVYKD